MDQELIIGFDALAKSNNKCRKGVTWKPSVASFVLNECERLDKLCTELEQGTYESCEPKPLKITHPKPRDALSISYRDRVYQRSINDNALYPAMSHSFILDNWACQKGKGTDACRERIKQLLREYYRKNGTEGYVYQFDIRHYYPEMDHSMTEACFARKLDAETLDRCVTVMRKQFKGTVGYNPGSQMIQIAGLSVLDVMDHLIKDKLHVRYYVRYMDDFFIIDPDQERLKYFRVEIERLLTALHFRLHPDKTMLYPLFKGIDILGFKFRLTPTGKVLQLIDPKNVHAERKKLYRLTRLAKCGKVESEKVDASYSSWRAHAAKGNTHNLLMRMDKYYAELRRETA